MPNKPASVRRFTVTIATSGGSAGPDDPTWASCSGGTVDFPQLPVIVGEVKAVSPPFAGPTLQALVMTRAVAAGPDPSGSALRDHLGAILAGAYPSALDIAIEVTSPPGRRVVYRRAYLRRWRLTPLDRTGKDACLETYEFVASDLEIDR